MCVCVFLFAEYPSIASAFKHITPVHVCHNKTQPYRESSYVYPNFEQYIGGTVMPSGIPSANDITASAVRPLEVGIHSTTSQATLSVSSQAASSTSAASQSTSSVASAQGDSQQANKNDKASGAVAGGAGAVGSVALAAVGGAAALFI